MSFANRRALTSKVAACTVCKSTVPDCGLVDLLPSSDEISEISRFFYDDGLLPLQWNSLPSETALAMRDKISCCSFKFQSRY